MGAPAVPPAPSARRWRDRAVWLGAGVLVGVGLCFAAAAAADTTSPAPADGANDTLYRKLQVLAEVLGHIETYYVDAVSPQELIYGATRGAVSALDPHSMFFDPAEYADLLDATEGEYAGIGVEVDLREEGAEIIAVLDDSPARRAGLVGGDVIVSIDGEQVTTLAFDTVQRRLRGAVGTKVVLAVRRRESEKLWTYTLVRSWIRVPPLTHEMLPGGVAVVRMASFPRRVASDLESLLGSLKPKGLVLDLRNNPGGLFDEAIEVCDLFLSGGPIVTATGRRGQQVEQRTASDRPPEVSYPVAILIDGGSASASEVVAGALQDRGRARLFGQRSYGKGSVQSILDLSDGSGLKLTIARYRTPSGKQIDGHGIDPDEPCAPPDDGVDEALQKAATWVRRQPSVVKTQ